MLCPCCSGLEYSQCCLPFHNESGQAPTPEALMRSRYSAYVTGKFDYVLDTYATEKKVGLTASALSEGEEETQWISLRIEDTLTCENEGYVTFLAVYKHANEFFKLHEKSRFIVENGKWRYIDGEFLADNGAFKPSRNDACICGSTKKFKRCCGA